MVCRDACVVLACLDLADKETIAYLLSSPMIKNDEWPARGSNNPARPPAANACSPCLSDGTLLRAHICRLTLWSGYCRPGSRTSRHAVCAALDGAPVETVPAEVPPREGRCWQWRFQLPMHRCWAVARVGLRCCARVC